MELTPNQLRQIILEEMQRLGETDEVSREAGSMPALSMGAGAGEDLETRVAALEDAVNMLRNVLQQRE